MQAKRDLKSWKNTYHQLQILYQANILLKEKKNTFSNKNKQKTWENLLPVYLPNVEEVLQRKGVMSGTQIYVKMEERLRRNKWK